MDDLQIDGRLLEWFSANPLESEWSVSETLTRGPEELRVILADALGTINQAEVAALVVSDTFRFFNGMLNQDAQEHQARIDIFRIRLDATITSLRRQLLMDASKHERPAPYDHPSLAGISLEDHALVDLKHFSPIKRRFLRDGYEFHIVPSLPGLNSTYWVKEMILREQIVGKKMVRLDPLLIQPEDGQQALQYKAAVYCPPVDWKHLHTLVEEWHARWIPDNPAASEIACTEVVLSARGNEIHFTCEEVPRREFIARRGSRYFHSVYDSTLQRFVHADGAVRLYSDVEIEHRMRTHLRRTGKIGTRIKIFQVDGEVPLDLWSGLVGAFFVWNRDIEDYFQGVRTLDRVAHDL